MYLIRFSLGSLIISGMLLSQSFDSIYVYQTDPENFFPISEDEENSDLHILLEDLKENPVNLNTAELRELRVIPFLNDQFAIHIINYRTRNGHIFSPAELFMIKELPDEIVRCIIPYLTVSEKETAEIRWYSDFNLNLRSRVKRTSFSFSDWGNLNKLKISLGDKIKAGFLTEKDQGEMRYNDFSSGYLQLNDLGFINSIIFGDFNIETGQGLLFWSPYSIPKGSEIIRSVYKKGRGLNPYGSSNEFSFYRGIAAVLSLNNFRLQTFYSIKKSDASLDSSGNIVRFNPEGYHRTSGEMKKRNAVQVRSLGLNLDFESELLKAGFSIQNTLLDHIYNSFNYINGYSLNAELNLHTINVFGELAFSGKYSALSVGINIPLDGMELITNYRNRGKSFPTVNCQNNSMNQSEIYTGFRAKTQYGSLDLYMDQYTFFQSDNSGAFKGYDINMGFHSALSRALLLNIRYKICNEDYILNNLLSKRNKQNLRSDIILEKGMLRMKLRGDLVLVNIKNGLNESGILLMQEIKYNFVNGISILLRSSYFKTDSFKSALYEYEYGVPGLIENRVLFGEGLRINACLSLHFNNLPAFYLKYSETIKNGTYNKSYPEIVLQTEINYDN